jgi:hypothetical protein
MARAVCFLKEGERFIYGGGTLLAAGLRNRAEAVWKVRDTPEPLQDIVIYCGNKRDESLPRSGVVIQH